MKKSLIALAALAAVGVASAQSCVTLSGTIGTTLQTSVTEGATAAKRTGLARSTGAIQMTGTEDLGGGLRAGFRFEELIGGYQTTAARVTTGTGINTGNFGSRQAFLTLSGGFGSIKLGRDLDGNSQMIGVGNVSGANATVGFDGSSDNSVFYGNIRSNSVSYTTPAFNGITASFGITPADYDKLRTGATSSATAVAAGNVICANAPAAAAGTCTNALATATRPYSSSAKQDNPSAIGLSYNQGPLNVGFVQTRFEGSLNTKATVIAANYDFGVVRVGALTQTVEADGKADRKSSLISANVPMGAISLQAAYGKANAESNAFSSSFVDEVKHTMLGAQYNFSKRTAAYVIFNTKKVAGSTLSDHDYKETGVGIRHAF